MKNWGEDNAEVIYYPTIFQIILKSSKAFS